MKIEKSLTDVRNYIALLILLIILDFTLTGIGVFTFGPEQEANLYLRIFLISGEILFLILTLFSVSLIWASLLSIFYLGLKLEDHLKRSLVLGIAWIGLISYSYSSISWISLIFFKVNISYV